MKIFFPRLAVQHIQLAISYLLVESKLKEELESGFIQGLEIYNKKKH